MKRIIHSDAFFSPDRVYRYALWRIWDESLPKILFIGLNPSTADEIEDDPTNRRCKRYAYDWGYGGYIMSNIFGYRSTDPKNLYNIEDPIGPDNNFWLKKLQNETILTVGAWGNHGKLLNRGDQVIELVNNLYCLRTTKEGHPCHPLYLPSKLTPILYK